MDGAGWDHSAFVAYLREVFEPMKPLLANTGDELDFERFRFFSGTALNGQDETAAIIPLMKDSPSQQLAMKSEQQAPLAEHVPLPLAGFLALDPCTCFHAVKNGVPYLYRALGYDVQAELVDASGARVRSSTDFAWKNRGAPKEGEWVRASGNITFHMISCATVNTNQG